MSKSMDQLLDTKADLESYFTSDVLKAYPWMSSEWVFVPMVYCEEIEDCVMISQTCVDFVIKGKYFYYLITLFENRFVFQLFYHQFLNLFPNSFSNVFIGCSGVYVYFIVFFRLSLFLEHDKHP